jgi:hypothetical protein
MTMLTTRFVSCAAVALCALAVSHAQATSLVKFRDWEPLNDGIIENPDADGMAILRYNADLDQTEITMVLHRLQPNTEYGVFVLSDNADFASWFTTSSNGSIMFQNQDPWGSDLTSDNPELFIFRGTDPWDFENHVLHSTPYIK